MHPSTATNAAAPDRDKAKCLAVVRDILDANDSDFRSRAFFVEQVKRFGLSKNSSRLAKTFPDLMNESLFGLLQWPTEFADFLFCIAGLGIRNTVEIGVYRGASSYIMAAVLQRANRSHRYTMVDVSNELLAPDELSAADIVARKRRK